MLMWGAVSAREMGQNNAQATKLGVGKQQGLTRLVLWLQEKAWAEFLNKALQIALGPAKI